MDETILKDSDLLEASHWPVIAVLGLYRDESPGLLATMSSAAKGEGTYCNDCNLVFWGDLDEYERNVETPFDVECVVVDDSCQLSYGELFECMKIACGRYGDRRPDSREELERDLEEYSKRFVESQS